jgi:hypothetical protein
MPVIGVCDRREIIASRVTRQLEHGTNQCETVYCRRSRALPPMCNRCSDADLFVAANTHLLGCRVECTHGSAVCWPDLTSAPYRCRATIAPNEVPHFHSAARRCSVGVGEASRPVGTFGYIAPERGRARRRAVRSSRHRRHASIGCRSRPRSTTARAHVARHRQKLGGLSLSARQARARSFIASRSALPRHRLWAPHRLIQ